MLRFTLALLLVLPAVPALSETDMQTSCAYQADVVKAVQDARLENVDEEDVSKLILDSDPEWPDNYDKAIPLVTPWVYELPIKQVRNNDLGDVWTELCLQQK